MSKKKPRLLEEALLSKIPKENIIIYDKGKEQLNESVKGKSFPCRGILKNVPVTKFSDVVKHENLNGRGYPRKLWENVYKSGVFEGSTCDADHAEEDDEGSVMRTTGVWHNFHLGEKQAYADLHCVGENGQLMLEIVSAGGSVGFSTVGFGEMMEDDEHTVNPDSFEYSQTDWVKRPSQEVYATQENLEEPKAEIPLNKDEKDEKESAIQENFTNKKEDKSSLKEEIIKEKENKEGKKMSEKYQESVVRNNITTTIRIAKKGENLLESIQMLKETSIPEDMPDLKAKVEATIDELQVKMESQKSDNEKALKEASNQIKTLEESVKTLNEKYTRAKAVIEKVGLSEDINIAELKENVQTMTEEIKSLKENEAEMLKDLGVIDKLFENRIAKKMEITKPSEFVDLMEDTIQRDKDISYLKSKTESLNKKLAKAEKYIGFYEKELEKRGFIFEDEEAPIEDETKEPEMEEDMPMDGGSVEDGEMVEEDDDFEGVDKEPEMEEGEEEIPVEDENQDMVEDEEMPIEDEDPEMTEDEDIDGEKEDDEMMEDAGDSNVPGLDPDPIESQEGMLEDEEMDGEKQDDELVEEEGLEPDTSNEKAYDGALPGEKMGESVQKYKFTFGNAPKKPMKEGKKGSKGTDKKPPKKDALKEKKLIEAFIVRESKKNPSIKVVQKDMLKMGTLSEAVTFLMRYEQNKKKKDQAVKVPTKRYKENVVEEKPVWLRGRE